MQSVNLSRTELIKSVIMLRPTSSAETALVLIVQSSRTECYSLRVCSLLEQSAIHYACAVFSNRVLFTTRLQSL